MTMMTVAKADKVTTNAHTRGRKPRVTYSESLVLAILDRVAQGEPLSRVCNSPKMPTRKSFFEWVAKYPMIQAQYEFAIQMRADLYAEETISISDEIVIETKHDGKDVTLDLSASVAAHNRLRVDARKWYASKLAPKKYGEKLDVEVDQRRVVTLINLGGRGPVEGK